MIFNRFIYLLEELPYLKCPLHTVLKLTPVAYGEKLTSLTQTFAVHVNIVLLYIYPKRKFEIGYDLKGVVQFKKRC